MKLQTGSLFRTVRGRDSTTGGMVFYPAKGQQLGRSFVVGVNPSTTPQVAQRSYFAEATQGWSLLTAAEMNAWILAAKRVRRRNVDGVRVRLSGIAFFVEVNIFRLMAGEAMTDIAPTDFSASPLLILGTPLWGAAATWEIPLTVPTSGSRILLKTAGYVETTAYEPSRGLYKNFVPAPNESVYNSGFGAITYIEPTSSVWLPGILGGILTLEVTVLNADYVRSPPSYFKRVVAAL